MNPVTLVQVALSQIRLRRIAKSQDVPVAAISEAMGHTSERTTRIYLKWFDNTLVDNANQKVLNAVA